MCDFGYPCAACRGAFHPAYAAVRHPYPVLVFLAARIGDIHTVHHVIFVIVDILISEAAGIVYLFDCGGLYPGAFVDIPRILMDEVLDQRVCDIGIDSFV